MTLLGRSLLAICFGVLAATSLAFAQEDEDLDDLMGGFEDEFDVSEIETDDEIPAWLAALPYGEEVAERVDLSGSLAAGIVYNYLDHSVSYGDELGRTTHYGNLSRLDLDGFLQLDVDLPADWQIRAEALGWYDFAYRARGRGRYGGEVIDVYEWQVDSGEAYVTGPLTDNIDLTVGRKIVNWGRSDTFRIVDVVNPLDNKEPGLVDIEDLRRPTTMVKLDATSGPWHGTFLVIPEHRFDRLPPPGSDFFPDLAVLRAAGQPLPPIRDRGDFEGTPGLAARFGGNFSGWDFTVYGAYVNETSRVSDIAGFSLRQEANRMSLVGAAGNYTVGSWLFKIESGYIRDLAVLRAVAPPTFLAKRDVDRVDTMLGVEYFGSDNLVIALEIVNRHLLGSASNILITNGQMEQSRFETALRVSKSFFRERLDVTLLGLGIGERFQGGGIFRASGDFEITDSWAMTGGILIFMGGPKNEGLGLFDSNDRLFAEFKYSF